MFYYWAMSRRKRTTAKKVATPPRVADKAPADAQGFYSDSLSDAERERLAEARRLEGLTEEIALLRVKLSGLMAEHPDDMDGLIKAVRLLVQAVATKYRLSPEAKDDLLKSVADVVNGVGREMLPDAFRTAAEE
ncbi:MAG: hypothetical protein HY671_00065 [Chloroflexi bacterium]|nr:hypothetical protein [Chloroflexota bacterium]